MERATTSLPDAALAGDQHLGVRAGHAFDFPAQLLDQRAGANEERRLGHFDRMHSLLGCRQSQEHFQGAAAARVEGQKLGANFELGWASRRAAGGSSRPGWEQSSALVPQNVARSNAVRPTSMGCRRREGQPAQVLNSRNRRPHVAGIANHDTPLTLVRRDRRRSGNV